MSIQQTRETKVTSADQQLRYDTELHPRQDLVDYVKAYAKEKPGVAAMWCFGVGFIVGWKLKPW